MRKPVMASTTRSRPPKDGRQAALPEMGARTADMPPPCFQWCVVGAGPAGIAAVGLLLDSSIPPSSVLWIDPSFSVGDFGTNWKFVSSNTTVGLFLRFYRHCRSFEFGKEAKASGRRRYAIENMEEKETCFLDVAAEPLREITQILRKKVASVEGAVVELREKDAKWACIVSSSASFISSNVILATGAVPRSLPFHRSFPTLQVIPITVALNPSLLYSAVTSSDTVAIFGSSHTAIILMRGLLERPVKKVINLYRDPLRYALYMGDWILFDDTGLKGDTARWSRENLHGELPDRLVRALSTDESVAHYLPLCTKVIYATGFERREIPPGIEGLPPRHSYNARCGIIAPGLFGCGIGYPEQRADRYGNEEMRVGLWKFMEYLDGVIPLWKEYSVLQGIGQPKGGPASKGADGVLKSKL